MTAAAPIETATEAVVLRNPAALKDSPLQLRAHYDEKALEELTASVRENGVVEPLIVRPAGDDEEIVEGHRRKRAAIAAERAWVPVIVREMTDVQVRKVQLLASLRVNLNAIEEADGFQKLITEHGYSRNQIAAELGKSNGYVCQRLAVLQATPKVREAYFKGTITVSHLLRIARQVCRQNELLNDVARDGHTLSVRETEQIIQTRYMLRLVDAPFDKTDADLVPNAGACTACPKRTGNQPELFDDVKSKDLCTDSDCFGEKKRAAYDQQAHEAEKRGCTVLTEKDSKAMFPVAGILAPVDPGYVNLKSMCADDQSGRTWGQVLGKKHGIRIVVARDPEGGVHELVPTKEALRVGRESGALPPPQKSAPPTKEEREAKRKIGRASCRERV